MADTNKSYRIRTRIGSENTDEYITVNADLVQDYDTFEVLSVNIKSKDAYSLHNSNYGVVVGRVIANNGFGIPNAKISIFISADSNETGDISYLYPFSSSVSKDRNGVKYNLLPNERVDGCHQQVGTFPSKRYALDNDVILEVYDKYYTYTTRTNNSGDYMICGVPVGAHTLHMDLDLSDCGILSQKPRDFVYKGYTIEQFESPTKFKSGTDFNNLSQIFTQDQVVNVNPFWGNSDIGETIGITRADIDVNFKFESTCVFMGSIFSDNSSNGFSKKCIPTENMGNMEELVTGEGKIEMIRKTPGGNIEQFVINGNKLINANGVWCYQIPMNLDYMVTDEYGNMVPTDNPEKGLATRASVRFRISMEDTEENTDNFFRGKVLVPNNPQKAIIENIGQNGITAFASVSKESYDYEFGTYTKEDSFRDLFWNNVYSVKSYVPRIQKSANWNSKPRFSGIKHCQNYGPNNPIPYNNIRIKLPLMFAIMCALIKAYIFIVSIINTVTVWIFRILAWIADNVYSDLFEWPNRLVGRVANSMCNLRLIVLKDGLCPDLENWYFAPSMNTEKSNTNPYYFSGYTSHEKIQEGFAVAYFGGSAKHGEDDDGYDYSENGFKSGMTLMDCDNRHCTGGTVPQSFDEARKSDKLCWSVNIMERTLGSIASEEFEQDDGVSIDAANNEEKGVEPICITKKTDYLISCIEMNLAQEYKVINFDFYNDWINGAIYNPRWVRYVKKKVRFLWITWANEKVKGCMDDSRIFSLQRYYVQQCAIGYEKKTIDGYNTISNVSNPLTNPDDKKIVVRSNNFHKKHGMKLYRVFGLNGGICHELTTTKGQKVYYLKPCEFDKSGKKVNLFATDIILLGTFNDCDINGVPKTFQHLTSSTYIMPTNLALTNMDTNGPLYAKDNGTICLGNGEVVENNIKEIEQTIKSEIEYYKGTQQDISPQNRFMDNETFGDTMAITEAAGISWNYTGPSQGNIDEKKMYYPGGHFLGLSCVNAQTNIKTCLNLSRICEIGTEMSQRKENVRSVNENGFSYTYSVPTGFISGDDISDVDFRSMFATLNKKRLKATKRNNSTGYKFYDFEFSSQRNFDGAFRELVYEQYPDGNPYNMKIKQVEEDLSEYGIRNGNDRNDFDSEEADNTQTRTMESFNLDYYLFRFGLTYDKANKGSEKFLIREYDDESKSNKYYLPQYENSFYFYFGLQNGATALDEFNKQFYAECDEIKVKKEPKLFLISDITSFCEGKGTIQAMTEGISVPYQSIEVYCHETKEKYVIGERLEYDAEIAVLNQETFYIPKEEESAHTFDFGKYTVTVTDEDGIVVSNDVELGIDLFTYSYSVVNFNVNCDSDNWYSSEISVFDGGFVAVENFSSAYNDDSVEYRFELMSEDEDWYNGEWMSVLYNDAVDHIVDEEHDIDWYVAFGRKKDIKYGIYLRYKCKDSDNFVNIRIGEVKFKDNSDVQLRIGYKDSDANFDPFTKNYGDIIVNQYRDWWWDSNTLDIGAELHQDLDWRWFLRKMFFKQKNDDTFDSNVFAVGGRKVLWGVPQSRNMAQLNGWDRIYCSDRIYELPSGTYLDDTRTITPTYGTNVCGYVDSDDSDTMSKSVGGNKGNGTCTYHYCAQAYNGTDVSGYFGFAYDRNNYYGHGKLFEMWNGYKFFHEGYGCVFKPLPFGNLIFFEYNGADDLLEQIEERTDTLFGVVYPTFIYPVIKRPFFANFKMVIWNENGVASKISDDGEYILSNINKNYGAKILLNIRNGITYNRKFSQIEFFDENLENVSVEYGDTHGLGETSSEDRIHTINWYKNICFDTFNQGEYNNSIDLHITEGYPETLGYNYANGYHLNKSYDFLENIVYGIEGNKITFATALNDIENNVEYYVGHYNLSSDGIEFLSTKSIYSDDKYACTSTTSTLYNVVLCVAGCKFKESENIHVSKWYRDVFVELYGFHNYTWVIKYEYKDAYGTEQEFTDSFYSTKPLNGVLDSIYNGETFFLEKAGSFVFPFKPILNYYVKEHIKIGGVEYDNFDKFMQKLIKNKKLMPINYLNSLSPVGNGDVVFCVGVKTIQSSEDINVVSQVYKVYPNITKAITTGNGSYDLIITSEQEGNCIFYHCGGKVDMSVGCGSPCNIVFESEGLWCYYEINGEMYYGRHEVTFDGINKVPISICADYYTVPTNTTPRSCKFKIYSVFGAIRDTYELTVIQYSDYTGSISVNEGPIILECRHSDVTIPFDSSGQMLVYVSTEPVYTESDWIQISNSPVQVTENANVTVVVRYNGGEQQRSVLVVLTPECGEAKRVKIIQNSPKVPPFNVIANKIRTNHGYLPQHDGEDHYSYDAKLLLEFPDLEMLENYNIVIECEIETKVYDFDEKKLKYNYYTQYLTLYKDFITSQLPYGGVHVWVGGQAADYDLRCTSIKVIDGYNGHYTDFNNKVNITNNASQWG